MSDFLTRLVQRQWGRLPTIQPRLPSVFAQVTDQVGFQEAEGVADATVPLIKERTPQVTLEGRQVREQEPPRSPAAPPVTQVFQPTVESHPASRLRAEAPDSPRIPDRLPLVEMPGIIQRDAPRVNAVTSVMPRMSEHRQVEDGERQTQRETRPREGRRGDEKPYAVPSDISGRITMRPLVEPSAHSQVTPQQVAAPVSLVVAGSLAERAQNLPQAVAEPPVQVTIGRIEVTAAPAPSPPKRTPTVRKPAMSLDDYLARRRRRES